MSFSFIHILIQLFQEIRKATIMMKEIGVDFEKDNESDMVSSMLKPYHKVSDFFWFVVLNYFTEHLNGHN